MPPDPEVPYLIFPEFTFAYEINSRIFLIGNFGFITTKQGDEAIKLTGEKSFSGSYANLGYKDVLTTKVIVFAINV